MLSKMHTMPQKPKNLWLILASAMAIAPYVPIAINNNPSTNSSIKNQINILLIIFVVFSNEINSVNICYNAVHLGLKEFLLEPIFSGRIFHIVRWAERYGGKRHSISENNYKHDKQTAHNIPKSKMLMFGEGFPNRHPKKYRAHYNIYSKYNNPNHHR